MHGSGGPPSNEQTAVTTFEAVQSIFILPGTADRVHSTVRAEKTKHG